MYRKPQLSSLKPSLVRNLTSVSFDGGLIDPAMRIDSFAGMTHLPSSSNGAMSKREVIKGDYSGDCYSNEVSDSRIIRRIDSRR